MTVHESRHPECDKLASLRMHRMAAMSFIEWLHSQDYQVTTTVLVDDEGLYGPVKRKIEQPLSESAIEDLLIYGFFEIDRDKIESERRAMYEAGE